MTDPWRFQRWAFETVTGNPARKGVLSMLAMMADSTTGRCEARRRTIAQGAEVSERTVSEHLRELELAGLIARRPQFRIDNGRRGDEFLLLAPGVSAWPDGTPLTTPLEDPARGDSPESGTPPLSPASRQELPPSNGLLPVGEREAVRAPARPITYKGRRVSRRDQWVAMKALAVFCECAGRVASPLTSDGRPSPSLKQVIGAVLGRPYAAAEDWERAVRNTFAAPPDWVEGKPKLGHIFGERAADWALANDGIVKKGRGRADPGREERAAEREAAFNRLLDREERK